MHTCKFKQNKPGGLRAPCPLWGPFCYCTKIGAPGALDLLEVVALRFGTLWSAIALQPWWRDGSRLLLRDS